MQQKSEEIIIMTKLPVDKFCRCSRCNYEWTSRKTVPPAVCPRCRSDAWNIRRYFRCQHCLAIFEARYLDIYPYIEFNFRPNCKSSRWNRDIEDQILRYKLYEDRKIKEKQEAEKERQIRAEEENLRQKQESDRKARIREQIRLEQQKDKADAIIDARYRFSLFVMMGIIYRLLLYSFLFQDLPFHLEKTEISHTIRFFFHSITIAIFIFIHIPLVRIINISKLYVFSIIFILIITVFYFNHFSAYQIASLFFCIFFAVFWGLTGHDQWFNKKEPPSLIEVFVYYVLIIIIIGCFSFTQSFWKQVINKINN